MTPVASGPILKTLLLPITHTSAIVSISVNANKLSATVVETVDLAEMLDIYPNPTAGYFTIEFDIDQSENVSTEIYDHLGSKIYSTEVLGHVGAYKKGINLKRLPSGLYYVRIKIGDEIINKKIMIRRE